MTRQPVASGAPIVRLATRKRACFLTFADKNRSCRQIGPWWKSDRAQARSYMFPDPGVVLRLNLCATPERSTR